MHNKLLVADNINALIGGRNIGDQYFQIDPDAQFADDDVYVAGPMAQKLSASFDEFWNSALAIPVQALSGGKSSEALLANHRVQLATQLQQAQADGVDYLRRAASGDPVNGILANRLPLIWTSAQVLYDSPNKKRTRDGSMIGRLMYDPVAQAAAAVTTELLMITPYLVPSAEEMQLLIKLRQRNVRVRILTSSLEATGDVLAHSGYIQYRQQLVRAGVELYEVRAMLGANSRGSGQTAAVSRHGNYGLHAKLFVFDRRRLFVGSMNFDQRSLRLNTEIGLLIDSPEMSEQTVARFDAMTQPGSAYFVTLGAAVAGRQPLVWRTQEAGKAVEYGREPSPSMWKRLEVRILSMLPLKSQL
jgi:putative cardiolipin synthase